MHDHPVCAAEWTMSPSSHGLLRDSTESRTPQTERLDNIKLNLQTTKTNGESPLSAALINENLGEELQWKITKD